MECHSVLWRIAIRSCNSHRVCINCLLNRKGGRRKMKKSLSNSIRSSINQIDALKRESLNGYLYVELDGATPTAAYFEEYETGRVYQLRPDTTVTMISNSDETLVYTNLTGRDVLETMTLDGKVAYAGAGALLAISEAKALLIDAEAEQPQEEAEPKCTITLLEKEHLPGAFIVEVLTPECKRTIHHYSDKSRTEYVDDLVRQLEFSGVSYVVKKSEGESKWKT